MRSLERQARVARLRQTERRHDLRGVNGVGRSGRALAGPAASLAKQARVRDVAAGDGLPPLLEREKARALEDLGEVLERQRCARVGPRVGDDGRGHGAWRTEPG